MSGAKERTDVGAELGTDDLVGADFGAVRNIKSHLYCTALRQCNIGAVSGLALVNSGYATPGILDTAKLNVRGPQPFTSLARRAIRVATRQRKNSGGGQQTVLI